MGWAGGNAQLSEVRISINKREKHLKVFFNTSLYTRYSQYVVWIIITYVCFIFFIFQAMSERRFAMGEVHTSVDTDVSQSQAELSWSTHD